jgi:hypothetical protein
MGHIALKTVEASMDVAPGHGGSGHDHRMLILKVQAAQHELPVLLDLSSSSWNFPDRCYLS